MIPRDDKRMKFVLSDRQNRYIICASEISPRAKIGEGRSKVEIVPHQILPTRSMAAQEDWRVEMNQAMQHIRPGRILIVDDRPAELELLRNALKEGYTVHSAANGELALRLAESTPPDLILLDITMPGLDGYQVCQQLKSNESTRDIPVIFLATRAEIRNKVKGFQLGAIDYITRPFRIEAVLTQVKSQLAIYAMQKQLAEQNQRLQQEIVDRQRAEDEVLKLNAELETRVRERIAQLEDTHQELPDGEARYRELLQSVTSYVYTVEVQQGQAVSTTHGPGSEAVTGYTSADYTADPYLWLRMVQADDRDRVTQAVDRLLTGKAIQPLEHRIYHKDGSLHWIRHTLAPHFDQQARLVSYDGIIEDITERKLAEQALRESEEKYRAVIETTDTGYAVLDEQGQVVDANLNYARLTGHSSVDEILGRQVLEWTAPHDFERNQLEVSRCLEYGFVKNLVIDYAHADGAIVPIEINAHTLTTKQGRIIVTLCRDITGRKRVEEALRESEGKFRSIFENSTAGIALVGLDGRFLMVNPAFSEIFGYSAAELLTADLYKITHPDDIDISGKAVDRALHNQGKSIRLIKRYIHKDGHTIWADISSVTIFDAKGQPSHFLTHILDITERKQAEEALRQSEERYRQLVMLSPDLIAIHQAGHVVFVNDAGVKLCGADNPDQILGRLVTDFVPPAFQPLARERMRQTITADKPRRYEQKLLRLDGTELDIEATGMPFIYQNRPAIQLIIHDITERKRAEQALRASEENFRSIFENSTAGVALVGLDGRYRMVNPAFSEILGYTAEELLAIDFWKLTHPDDMEHSRKAMRQALDKKGESTRYTKRYIHKDGHTIWADVSSNLMYDTEGKPSYFITHVTDITQRKQSEEELYRSREMLRTVLDTIPQRVFWKDRNSVYVGCNKPFAQDCGYTDPSEIVGTPTADFYRADDRQVMETDQPKLNYEEPQIRPDGSQAWLMTSKMPLHDQDGRVTGVLGVYEDITERKQAEEALRQTQKLESLGILAGGVAHDFNNLLVAMLGQASLALQQLPGESPARVSVEKLVKAARHATELTRQLLAYSGRGQFQIQPIDLNVLIRDNLHLFEVAIPKNIQLRSQLAGSLPHIDGDIGQIQQVIMNLIINAAEAISPNPGAVTVTTSVGPVSAADNYLWQYTDAPLIPGDYVTLEVHDNGSGMDATTLSKIFDPFFTTKITGRGLGLAAVLGILRGHRGGLAVSSEVGRGTTFKLLFPISTAAPIEPLAAKVNSAVGLSPSLILVIDDEEPVREAVTDILESVGIRVITAADGEAGVALYRERRAEIRLVLLDLSMPGLSGVETFHELQKIDPNVAVILSSGYNRNEATRRFADQGLTGFLQKPYDAETLIDKIQQHLG